MRAAAPPGMLTRSQGALFGERRAPTERFRKAVGMTANLKKSCTAAVAALGIYAGLFTGTPASAAPVARVTIESVTTGAFLQGQTPYLSTADYAVDQWLLQSPEGAPPGVYQIQRSGTNDCINAGDDGDPNLVTCANVPGKSQLWSLDRTSTTTTIESSERPGQYLAQDFDLSRVVFMNKQADTRLLWLLKAASG